MIVAYPVASLVDTNILVYLCDPRDPRKRVVALEILREGLPHTHPVWAVGSVIRKDHRTLGLFQPLEAASKRKNVRFRGRVQRWYRGLHLLHVD